MSESGRKAKAFYSAGDALTGGALSTLRRALRSFAHARASEAAASVAYYALFSLFPLMLVLLALGSVFLESKQSYQETIQLMHGAIPVSRELIERNVQQVLERRKQIGAVSLAGLLWSGLGAFTTLARNINRAWTEADQRGFLSRRLVALGMVGVLVAPLLFSLLSTAALEILPGLNLPLWNTTSASEALLWRFLSSLVPWAFSFLMFLALYRWVPNTSVTWSAAFWGALVASVLWEAAKRGFTWYLGTGLAKYQLVYGSLGAVVALMFWIYLSAWVALFGAHLGAAVADGGQRG
jgi:membrane protein